MMNLDQWLQFLQNRKMFYQSSVINFYLIAIGLAALVITIVNLIGPLFSLEVNTNYKWIGYLLTTSFLTYALLSSIPIVLKVRGIKRLLDDLFNSNIPQNEINIAFIQTSWRNIELNERQSPPPIQIDSYAAVD